MTWFKHNEYVLFSDDMRFAINRAGMGETFAYTAVKLGKPWSMRQGERIPRGWDGSESIHVERDIPKDDETARREAVKRCMAACEAVADV